MHQHHLVWSCLHPRVALPSADPAAPCGGGARHRRLSGRLLHLRSYDPMNLRDFRRAGHWPTLLCAFLYFDVSFMIWVLLGPLAPGIAAELWPRPEGMALDDHLRQTAAWKGLLVSVPLLGGSVLRLVLGLMTDHIGARRTGLIGMALTALPLALGWLWADSLAGLLLVGLLLGVAGASFAAA